MRMAGHDRYQILDIQVSAGSWLESALRLRSRLHLMMMMMCVGGGGLLMYYEILSPNHIFVFAGHPLTNLSIDLHA